MKDYKIITHWDLIKFTEAVNNHLNKGYVCIGGMFVISQPMVVNYYQAVAKPL